MEQLCQPGGDILFQCGDARHDILHGFRCLILVEIAGHGDLVAHLGLAVVDPCVGGVGQNFPGKVGVNVLHQRHIFGVPQAGVRHRLATLQDNVARFVPLGALHHDLVVAELHALKHLALAIDAVFVAVHLAVGKLAVGGDDQLPAGIGDVVALGADALAAWLEAVAGVNKLYLARTVGGLILAEHPDVGGDAGVHEHIGGKLDDAVQPVIFQNILPDVAGPAAGIAAEQGRAVLDNGHLALVCQLGKAVQHKKLLTIADLGQTGRKTPHLAPGGFGFHRLLLPLPVDAEGRVGDCLLYTSNDITDACRELIVTAYGEFTNGKVYGDKNGIYCESKVFESVEFGYNKIVVERPQRDEAGNVILKRGKPVPDTSLRDTENVPLVQDIDAYFAREVLPYAPDAWIDHSKTKVGYEIPMTRYFYEYQAPEAVEDIVARITALEQDISAGLAELFHKEG